MSKPLKLAVAGLGTIGAGVVKALCAHKAELERRAGRTLEFTYICDRKDSQFASFPDVPSTTDIKALPASDADVIVELIGGENGVALELVEAALNAGKNVVTANKAMLARHGARLAALAEEKGVSLKFEAAVAGGIPILKSLRESLFVYGISTIRGILNGTCNYILTQMEETGKPFDVVLKDAQKLGYAEANPALDIGGGDTAHKLALLTALVFGVKPNLDAVNVEGIEQISPEDIAFAHELGYRIKLLGVARKTDHGIDQRVLPAMVRTSTPIADVDGVLNAVVVDSGAAGPFFFEGRGAGECPTANAVIADIIDIARGNVSYPFGIPTAELADLVPAPTGSARTAFYLRFQVQDAPGVLADVARTLAEFGVSIESMIQRGRSPGDKVSIVMLTHETNRESVAKALAKIATSERMLAPPCMIPMEAK